MRILQKMIARSRGVNRGTLRCACPPPPLAAERSGVTTSEALLCAGVLRASFAARASQIWLDRQLQKQELLERRRIGAESALAARLACPPRLARIQHLPAGVLKQPSPPTPPRLPTVECRGVLRGVPPPPAAGLEGLAAAPYGLEKAHDAKVRLTLALILAEGAPSRCLQLGDASGY